MKFLLISAAFFFFFLFLLEIIAYTIRWYTARLSINVSITLKSCVDFLIEYFSTSVSILFLLVDYLFIPFIWRFVNSDHRINKSTNHKNPVLLVYGYTARGFHMAILRYRLKRDSYNIFFFFCWPPKKGILNVANGLKDMVEKLSEVSPTKKVELVCHSLGGVVALYYITKLGGSDKIQHLVSLAAPFRGSKLWRLSPRKWCREILKPDNKLLKELTEEIPSQLKITSIYSSFDELVLPYHSSKLTGGGVENIEVDRVGHQRFVFSKKIYLLIRDSLIR